MKAMDERKGVTSISANARIDYILRFSQHAVLVIDEDPELCTQVGNQFLGSLTKEHNAAYVSLSSKLNDIQVRCRIIEQLFGNILFDPEQPLAVNVIKLSENNNDVITVVIGNAEFLSLQLFHELCQLSETAKKLKKIVNVVFLGANEAGKLIAENSSLFENKLSIIQAKTGQLVGVNSSLFKSKSPVIVKRITKAIILLVIIAGIVTLVSSSDVWVGNEQEAISLGNTANDKPKNNEFVEVAPAMSKVVESVSQPPEQNNNIANASEVFQMLVVDGMKNADIVQSDSSGNNSGNSLLEQASEPLSHAKEVMVSEKEAVVLDKTMVPANAQKQPTLASNIKLTLNEGYYQALESGVVIQFASFAKSEGFHSFIKNFKTNKMKGYIRSLKGTKSHIVTSEVYKTSALARKDIANLPQELRSRGPWIKSIQAINNEINLYQQAQ
jgi:DamX protein